MFEFSVAPTDEAPAAARSELAAWLGNGVNDGSFIDIVQLLVSELVTNCVRHARIGPDQLLVLTASLRDGTLRIAVHDQGVEGNVARRDARRPDDVGGFGLVLVARLSSDWGIERDHQGTTVWLELLTDPRTTG